MKRYNIHLDPGWMKALDEIRKAVIKEGESRHYYYDLTRADFIRVAIGCYFQLGQGYRHTYSIDLEKIIKKVVKKRTAGKGV